MSKTKKQKQKGFTLIELLLVLGLISIVGVSTCFLGLPAINQFACRSEKEMLMESLLRARNLSLVTRRNSQVQVNGDNFQIVSYQDRNDDPTVADLLAHKDSISITPDHDLFFDGYTGQLRYGETHVLIGSNGSVCSSTLTLNSFGTVIN